LDCLSLKNLYTGKWISVEEIEFLDMIDSKLLFFQLAPRKNVLRTAKRPSSNVEHRQTERFVESTISTLDDSDDGLDGVSLHLISNNSAQKVMRIEHY
jgi:hypothetical protein